MDIHGEKQKHNFYRKVFPKKRDLYYKNKRKGYQKFQPSRLK